MQNKKHCTLIVAVFMVLLLFCSCKKTSYTISIEDRVNAKYEQVVEKNDTLKEPTLPSRAEYQFIGWFKENDTTKYDFSTPVDSSFTLTAKWEKVKYTITINDGVNNTYTILVDASSKLEEPSALTKEDYHFDGWYLDSNLYSFDQEVHSSFTLTAKWTKEYYTVTLNDGINEESHEKVKVNECFTKPTDPTKSDSIFVGWYQGEELYDFTSPITSDITLTAKWQEKIYITYINGEETNKVEVEKNTSAVAPTEPVKSGYKFLGWFKEGSDKAYNFSALVTTSFTLTAKWSEVVIHQITYIYSLGTEEKEEHFSVEDGQKIKELVLSLPDGYVFDGWYLDQEYKTVANFNRGITKDMIYYGNIYSVPTHKITYHVGDGTLPKDAKTIYTEGTAYTLPTCVGATEEDIFIGWFLYSTASGMSISFISSTETADIEIYALFGHDETYSITYSLDGGTLDNTDVTSYSGLLSKKIYLPLAYKEGYYFRGFYESSDFSGNAIAAIYPGASGAKNYYAKYVEASAQNAKISIFGDSISTFYSPGSDYNSIYQGNNQFYFPKYSATVKSVYQTWWMKTIQGLSASLCINDSYSGTTACGGSTAGESDERIKKLFNNNKVDYPDIIIIYFGTNDNVNGFSKERFMTGYENMIKGILSYMPHVKLFFVTLGYTAYAAYSDSLRLEYNDVIKQLASTYSAGIIDVGELVTNSNYSTLLGDNLHYNATGMDEISKIAISTISQYYTDLETKNQKSARSQNTTKTLYRKNKHEENE